MKRILTMLAMAVVALALQAEDDLTGRYLYWMINAPAKDSVDYSYAVIVAYDGDVRIGPQSIAEGGEPKGNILPKADLYTPGPYPYYTEIPAGEAESLSFIVELWNSEMVGIRKSQQVTLADLVSTGYIYSEMGTAGIKEPYVFNAYFIPEPSGGLLVLLGLGALALRRKREVEV